MAIPASLIIWQAQTELQDLGGIRWPAAELVRHLDEGLLHIVTRRPDAKTVHEAFTPVQGALQTLPTIALAFVDIAGNLTGTKSNIRRVDKNELDVINPAWQSMTPVKDIIHFSHDLADPRRFYLYPPAATTASIELVYSRAPTFIDTPGGTTYASVVGDLDILETYTNALLQYILFKAWSKDAEFGGNAALAAGHYALYEKELGVQAASTAAIVSTK